MIVKLPPYLTPEDEQLAAPFPMCPPSSFEECVSVPEINYLMVKGILDNAQFRANMKDLPISISQTDSFFYSNIIEEGHFTGIVEHTISADYQWQ